MYDSTQDTQDHMSKVQDLLNAVCKNITRRSVHHDDSKLKFPEKEMYDEFTPKLRAMTYGSDEYKTSLKEMGGALQHHYEVNSHHPEHFKMFKCPVCKSVFRESEAPIASVLVGEVRICPNCSPTGSLIMECTLEPASGINGMSLLDLIEMLADWKAAGMRHADGDMLKSLEINRKRFEMSDQLAMIFENTIREMGWQSQGES